MSGSRTKVHQPLCSLYLHWKTSQPLPSFEAHEFLARVPDIHSQWMWQVNELLCGIPPRVGGLLDILQRKTGPTKSRDQKDTDFMFWRHRVSKVSLAVRQIVAEAKQLKTRQSGWPSGTLPSDGKSWWQNWVVTEIIITIITIIRMRRNRNTEQTNGFQ